MQISRAIEGILRRDGVHIALAPAPCKLPPRPSLVVTFGVRLDDREGDDVLETLEDAHEVGAVGKRAEQSDVEVVPVFIGGESRSGADDAVPRIVGSAMPVFVVGCHGLSLCAVVPGRSARGEKSRGQVTDSDRETALRIGRFLNLE